MNITEYKKPLKKYFLGEFREYIMKKLREHEREEYSNSVAFILVEALKLYSIEAIPILVKIKYHNESSVSEYGEILPHTVVLFSDNSLLDVTLDYWYSPAEIQADDHFSEYRLLRENQDAGVILHDPRLDEIMSEVSTHIANILGTTPIPIYVVSPKDGFNQETEFEMKKPYPFKFRVVYANGIPLGYSADFEKWLSIIKNHYPLINKVEHNIPVPFVRIGCEDMVLLPHFVMTIVEITKKWDAGELINSYANFLNEINSYMNSS